MREKREFGKRKNYDVQIEPAKKYFLVFEGQKTEEIYFSALNKNRNNLNINPLIEIIPIIRCFDEGGLSNPQKIVDLLTKNLEEKSSGMYSYETIINYIVDYLIANNSINHTNVSRKLLVEVLKKSIENCGRNIDDSTNNYFEVCELIWDDLKNYKITEVADNIEQIMDWAEISYDKDFDKICIIVDRDEESFKSDQYDDVLIKCRVNNYSLFVTNPCFEFWLLMHYDDVTDIEEDKVRKNERISSKNRFLDLELKKRMSNYRKNKYNAQVLVENIDKAINNSSRYCSDVQELKYKIGTNLAKLIIDITS